MAINIGNQFNYGREDVKYGKVPLWDSVDEQYPSGVYVGTDEQISEGVLIPAGTPVQIDNIGGKAKFGKKATTPTGLTRYDAVMGKNGCTVTVVTRGAIYEDRIALEASHLTDEIKKELAGRILFIKENAAGDV